MYLKKEQSGKLILGEFTKFSLGYWPKVFVKTWHDFGDKKNQNIIRRELITYLENL